MGKRRWLALGHSWYAKMLGELLPVPYYKFGRDFFLI